MYKSANAGPALPFHNWLQLSATSQLVPCTLFSQNRLWPAIQISTLAPEYFRLIPDFKESFRRVG